MGLTETGNLDAISLEIILEHKIIADRRGPALRQLLIILRRPLCICVPRDLESIATQSRILECRSQALQCKHGLGREFVGVVFKGNIQID